MNQARTAVRNTSAPSRRPRRPRAALATAVVLVGATSLGALGSAQAATPGTSLSAATRSSVTSHWTTRHVARGVEVRTGTVTNAKAAPAWTITVQAPTTGRLSGAATWATVGPRSWADTTAGQLRANGFAPRVDRIDWPAYSDTPRGLMGLRVRVGSYATQAEAAATAQAVTAAGFHTAVEWTGYDADQRADVENLHVAIVDPHAFTGTVTGTHDGSVTQRRTTSSVAAKLRSLVGVNAGFFVTSDSDGVQGIQSGIAAYDGRLESMAAGARAALVLTDGGRHVRVADLTSTAVARVGGARYTVEGINRVPGTVRDCGRPGGTPSERPWQDVTCHKTDDLVLFTPEFTAALPTGTGSQAVLDRSGKVVSVGARGGLVPAGGSVLQGIGSAADWLTAHAAPERRVDVEETVRDERGRKVVLGKGDSIVSAAPTLVENGRVCIDAAAEGTVDPKDLSFGYAWANTRQPRTMAGIDRRGRLILATVDGRQAGGSEGFTLQEAAEFMRSLGADQALNLDGGGSTAMAVNGALVNHTSDATGERAVGDTLQVLPRTNH